MPNIKSAAKNMRKSRVRNLRNRAARSELKSLARKVVESAAAGKLEEAQTNFRIAARRLDQAASKKVIHVNAASRKKSRLSHVIVKAKSKKA